eukprot:GFUD01091479.1.p1 GENE.GFUD01091479.1~~GFUD01091479.1.p1  ORF type:complete len:149 (-),score=13.87 GFUD01091479.1:190-636(-)
MFRSILLFSFLAYVSTTTEGTDEWMTGIWTDSLVEASKRTYGWMTGIWTEPVVEVSKQTYGWMTEIWTEPVVEVSKQTYGWMTDRRCKCSGVMVMVDKETGESVGECTKLKEGRPFCFVDPSACQDSVPSSQFPDLYWSYAACEVESF